MPANEIRNSPTKKKNNNESHLILVNDCAIYFDQDKDLLLTGLSQFVRLHDQQRDIFPQTHLRLDIIHDLDLGTCINLILFPKTKTIPSYFPNSLKMHFGVNSTTNI